MQKEEERENFRIILGFKENDIYERKEYSVLKKIKKTFLNEIMIEQYRVKSCFIDFVFPVHKLGIDIDENGNLDRCKIKEEKSEHIIK